MDRELVLAILALAVGGLALELCGWWPAAVTRSKPSSGRHVERLAWRRIWGPLLPTAMVLASLAGWALVEPEAAEPVPARLILVALPFAMLLVRAAARSLRAMLPVDRTPLAATLGFVRPRVVISARLIAALDEPALNAARAHEEAHARHRDPVRIWLAQLATDLQWPWPAAARRFRTWLLAMEVARDEEARAEGVEGADLAAAVLAAVRLEGAAPPVTGLTGDPAGLRERVERLLAPLSSDEPRLPSPRWLLPLALACAVAMGALFGEALVLQTVL